MATKSVQIEKPLKEHNGNIPAAVAFEKGKKHDFDLEVVLHSFRNCFQDENTLVLLEYLNAFHELCRFFKLTGPLFSFVARDIESKICAIEYRLKKDNGNNYFSIQSMIQYEISKGKTHHKGLHPSGSRTLLRLHHALEFILAFMDKITNSEVDAKASQIAWEVYGDTLSKHHPWITQKLAYVAVHALPSKQHLIEIMCKHDYSQVEGLLSQVVLVGKKVYDHIEDLMKMKNLFHIP